MHGDGIWRGSETIETLVKNVNSECTYRVNSFNYDLHGETRFKQHASRRDSTRRCPCEHSIAERFFLDAPLLVENPSFIPHQQRIGADGSEWLHTVDQQL